MADIVVTAASVVKGSNAVVENKFAGATITAGQSVYLDSADSLVKQFDADSATVAARSLYGIALNSASIGQPVAVQRGGTITIGGTTVSGTVYVGSDTAGGIMPAADLDSGDYVNIVGVGLGSSQIKLSIFDSGAAF